MIFAHPLDRAPEFGAYHALELTFLIARKEPRRHPRVAARWLLRYLEERPETTIAEAAMAASCLAALAGGCGLTLRALTDTVTSPRRTRGVA